jgi:alkylhydroperoxidase/carboxymuconolactone decarboxylase family protein YurZ
MIAEARELRDRLAATTDVETLSSWIDRNAAYDAALRQLYEALLESKGKVTDRVRSAIGAEQVARQQLPADTRALVVIMSDIAQGGLNQAVIAIEEARGALGSALDLQHRLQQSPELPG